MRIIHCVLGLTLAQLDMTDERRMKLSAGATTADAMAALASLCGQHALVVLKSLTGRQEGKQKQHLDVCLYKQFLWNIVWTVEEKISSRQTIHDIANRPRTRFHAQKGTEP